LLHTYICSQNSVASIQYDLRI